MFKLIKRPLTSFLMLITASTDSVSSKRLGPGRTFLDICLCSSGLLSAVLVTLGALYLDVTDDDEDVMDDVEDVMDDVEDRTEDNGGSERGDSTVSSLSKASVRGSSLCSKLDI